eukprot:TRINITY_DN836_c0_g1_i2.p1 TRINITY_DN836_c0_g1~~TRINITY_DN836_c0_g1_i2.p1  ORF type:complete len:298 (-),score=55.66 TRINITY_DN836_c0_g1_i2:123-1016(-)
MANKIDLDLFRKKEDRLERTSKWNAGHLSALSMKYTFVASFNDIFPDLNQEAQLRDIANDIASAEISQPELRNIEFNTAISEEAQIFYVKLNDANTSRNQIGVEEQFVEPLARELFRISGFETGIFKTNYRMLNYSIQNIEGDSKPNEIATVKASSLPVIALACENKTNSASQKYFYQIPGEVLAQAQTNFIANGRQGPEDIILLLLCSDEITFFRAKFSLEYFQALDLGNTPPALVIQQFPPHGINKSAFGAYGLRLYIPAELKLVLQYLARIHQHLDNKYRSIFETAISKRQKIE